MRSSLGIAPTSTTRHRSLVCSAAASRFGLGSRVHTDHSVARLDRALPIGQDHVPRRSAGAASPAPATTRSRSLRVDESRGEPIEARIASLQLDGSVTSWTPGDECLERGLTYAWFVRATVAGEVSQWSQPRLFEIPSVPSIDEVTAARVSCWLDSSRQRKGHPRHLAVSAGNKSPRAGDDHLHRLVPPPRTNI